MTFDSSSYSQGHSFVPSKEFTPSPQFLPKPEPQSQGFQFNHQSSNLFENEEQEQKYKTELCKNWIEVGVCRYGKKCRFAHGYEELSDQLMSKVCNDKLKTKNCRTFYQEKICLYGSRCLFRHEHRAFK